jgi:DHA1 family multidrug resistance protein-like MFS transporter
MILKRCNEDRCEAVVELCNANISIKSIKCNSGRDSQDGTMSEQPNRWQRTLWTVVAVQTVVALARSMVYPFLALYFIELGVKGLPAVEMWTGGAVSAGFFVAAFFAPLWGRLADRFGRKAMVLRATAAISVCSVLLGLVTAPWEVLFLRVLMGAVSGFGAASTALVATQVPEERLGFALGWLATGDIVGSLVGPLLGGILADHLHNYRYVFFVTAAIAAAAAASVFLFVHEQTGSRTEQGAGRVPFWRQLYELARHPSLAPMFLVVLLAEACTLGIDPIVPLFMRSLVDASWIATAAGIAAATTGLADMIASPWLGKRSDSIGYRRVLLISLAGAALFTIPQGFSPNYATFLGLRFGVGLFIGGIIPTANAWIGRLTTPAHRGQVYGIMASAAFLGKALGPIFAAGVAARFGFIAVFAVMGTIMLVNLAWVGRSSPANVPSNVSFKESG